MKNKIYKHCLTALVLITLSCNAQKTYKVKSPGKSNELVFDLTKTGQPQYRFSSNGKSVIEPSLLGFEFEGLKKMTEGFKVVTTEQKSINETWEQPWGEVKKIKDRRRKR
jgi:alpha-glucosidase